jgi:hypothetical protein
MPWLTLVEVRFDGVNWTDITDYICPDAGDALEISRGRPDASADVVAGRLTVPLDDGDGRFTMGRPGSPYWPGVITGTEVRVRRYYTRRNWAGPGSFEVDLEGWAAAGSVPPTPTRSSTHAADGSWAMLITWGTGGTGPQMQKTITGLRKGMAYTATGRAWVTAGSPAVQFAITGGATGAASSGTGAFVDFSLEFTATARSHQLAVQPATSPSAGQTVWIDQVMVRETSASSTYDSFAPVIYDRFTGNADGWALSWPSGGDKTAKVLLSASDMLKRLGERTAELRSVLEEEIHAGLTVLNGSCYYRLAESSEASQASDAGPMGQPPLLIKQVGSGGTIEFGSGTGPGTDELPAAVFTRATQTTGKYLRSTLRTPLGGSGVFSRTFGAWFNTTVADAAEILTLANSDDGSDERMTLAIDSAHKLKLYVYKPGIGTFITLTSAASVNDGLTHLAVGKVDNSGLTYRLFLDGVEVDSGVSANKTADHRMVIVGGRSGGDLFTGTLSHVFASSFALTFAVITDLWNAGDTGFAGDLTSARIARLAGYAGITSLALETGQTTVVRQKTSGQATLSAMRDVERTEGGLLFASRAGVLTLFNRRHRDLLTAGLVLDASAEHIDADLTMPNDDTGVINDFTASRPDSTSAHFADTASIDKRGYYRDSQSYLMESDTDLQAASEWPVTNFSVPLVRIPTLGMDLMGLRDVGTLFEVAQAVELWDRISAVNLPAQAPTPAMDLCVEGYTEKETVDSFGVVFNTSPWLFATVWILGTSALGVDTKLAW